jgi:hypothetical protein
MTKWALARPQNGQPRFFNGKFAAGESLKLLSPVTSAQPDQAKTYEDEVVVDCILSFLNLIYGIRYGVNDRVWIKIEMPEAWS